MRLATGEGDLSGDSGWSENVDARTFEMARGGGGGVEEGRGAGLRLPRGVFFEGGWYLSAVNAFGEESAAAVVAAVVVGMTVTSMRCTRTSEGAVEAVDAGLGGDEGPCPLSLRSNGTLGSRFSSAIAA